jgi:hypothetical protein
MTYTGRCNCGQVTLTAVGEPIAVRQCWCRQCQKISSGGPTNNAMFPTEAVNIEGARAESGYVAASGNTLTHEFCPNCGSHVLARSSARPQFRTIRLGMLDEEHGLSPAVAIWLDEAPPYAVVAEGMEAWPKQPPAPVVPSAGS